MTRMTLIGKIFQNKLPLGGSFTFKMVQLICSSESSQSFLLRFRSRQNLAVLNIAHTMRLRWDNCQYRVPRGKSLRKQPKYWGQPARDFRMRRTTLDPQGDPRGFELLSKFYPCSLDGLLSRLWILLVPYWREKFKKKLKKIIQGAVYL